MTVMRSTGCIVFCLCLLAAVSSARAAPGSAEFFINGQNNYDYADQTDIPLGFGEGEFTFEIWLKPNNSFPVGSVGSGVNQRTNWSNVDNTPYGSATWWFSGNFLLDGHNNGNFAEGTFSLQFYGSGRVRWLFGDGSGSIPNGGLWSVGASPASSTASLLDGNWHQVTLVRRWSGQTNATLEIWIDGSLVDTETSNVRTNMRQWWTAWTDYPINQEGWFWASEKQAAIGSIPQYEDYKGLIDEMRFWSRAKLPAEISSDFADPVVGNESGLLAVYRFGEAQGTDVCDSINVSRCLFLQNPQAGVWSPEDAPVSAGGDTQAPTVPGGLQGSAVSSSQIDLSWNASSDNVAVTGYDIRRDGVFVTTVSNTNFSDTGRSQNTTYNYTVAARDAAGNVSANSGAVAVTTLASTDTQAPTVPGNLQGSAVSPTQINLSWNASSDNVGVTGYDVRRDGVIVTTTANTSFNDTGLTQNTSYVYTVAARDAAGNVSAESSAASVTTLASSDTEAPTIPGNLQGSAASPTQVNLSWNASSDNVGVTGYDVRRDGVIVMTTANTSFNDTGLTQNTSYVYTVAARDAAGNVSAESNAASVTTLASSDTEAPTIPGNLQGGAASPTQINLSWTASTDNVGVAGYDVRRDGVVVTTTSATTYNDTGLSPDTSFVYTIVARDAAGNSSASSNTATISTLPASDTQAPTVPASLQGNATSATEIRLTWSASTDNVGVAGYEVSRDGIVITTTNTTSFSNTGLTQNTTYVYTVAARDAAGNVSSPSTIASVTTPPGTTARDSSGGGSLGSLFLLLLIGQALYRRRGAAVVQ